MTCVVGIVEKRLNLVGPDRVWIGADSQGTGQCDKSSLTTPKVFRLGQFLIGYTDAFRFGQLVRYAFSPPALEDGKDVEAYLVTRFADAMRQCLKDGGWAKTGKEEHNEAGIEIGGTLLVGVQGRLFAMQSNYAFLESREPYDAVGCGKSYALGSLHATNALPLRGGLSPKERLAMALEAAAAYDEDVGGPFSYECLE